MAESCGLLLDLCVIPFTRSKNASVSLSPGPRPNIDRFYFIMNLFHFEDFFAPFNKICFIDTDSIDPDIPRTLIGVASGSMFYVGREVLSDGQATPINRDRVRSRSDPQQ